MSADHPTSVVSNLQFLSQVTPITATAAGTSGTAVPPASAPAAPTEPVKPTKPKKPSKGPKRHLTTVEGDVAASETNLRASPSPDAQPSSSALNDNAITTSAQSTGNWLYTWWNTAKDTLTQLPTSSGPVLSRGPVGAKPVPAPAPVSAPAPVKAPKKAPSPVLHVPKPVVPPIATVTVPAAPAVPAAPNVVPLAATASHAIRVLLYSGEFDLNCNTLGVLHTLEANRWRNKYVSVDIFCFVCVCSTYTCFR